MTPDNSALFDVPPSAEPRLQAARKRLAKAQEEYSEARNVDDIVCAQLELGEAEAELAAAEREEIGRR